MDAAAPTPASPSAGVAIKTDILVIGAGQAGLSSAYHLQQRGLEAGRGFIVLDQSPQPRRRLAVSLALADALDRQPRARPARHGVLRGGRHLGPVGQGVHRRAPLLRRLRGALRPQRLPPGQGAGRHPARRPLPRRDRSRPVLGSRPDQCHRHLGDPVHPRLSGPRAVQGPPAPHARLQVRRRVRRPACGHRRRRHLGRAAAQRDLARHVDHLGHPARAALAQHALHLRGWPRGREAGRGPGPRRAAGQFRRLRHRPAAFADGRGDGRARRPRNACRCSPKSRRPACAGPTAPSNAPT